MYILLAIIFATAVGALVHVVTPGRAVRGVLLSGAIAAAVSAIIYSVFTWSGVAESNVWTWVGSIGGAIVVSIAGTILITRARLAHDAAEDIRLGIA